MSRKKINTLKELNEYERYLIKKEAAIKSLLTEDVKKLGSSIIPNSVGSIVGQTTFMQGLDMVAPLIKNKDWQGFFKAFNLFKYLPLVYKIFNATFKKDRSL